MDHEEKRIHPRWPVEKNVFCYINGARLDANTLDMSLGGMFLGTKTADKVPLEALVGLVFRSGDAEQHTTFLFGRVVRRQQLPVSGVGLKWEKAVTTGSPQALAGFLNRTFRIHDAEIIEEAGGPRGLGKAIFKFNSLHERKEKPPAEKPAGRSQQPLKSPKSRFSKGLNVTGAEMDELQVKIVKTEHTPVPQYVKPVPDYVREGSNLPHSPDRTGAITGMVKRSDLMAPTNQPGTMSVSGTNVDVSITRIGMDGMFVQTGVVPASQGADVCVRYEIRTKDGIAPVTCNCRILSVNGGSGGGAPGIYLEFTDVIEGAHPGILKRYVKWLHFRSLSGG